MTAQWEMWPLSASMIVQQVDDGTPFSPLRIVGLVWGGFMLALVVWRVHRGAASRFAVLLGTLAALTLIVASAFPGFVMVVFDPFLPTEQRGFPRLTGLLAVAVLVLIPYQFILTANNAVNRRDMVALVRALALEKYRGQVAGRPAPDVTVVIPAYNEEQALGSVLARIPESVCGLRVETVVVVDGATDGTEEVARGLGVPAVHLINRGGGAAVVTGLEIAQERNARIAVIMDADGQHLPEQMSRLVGPILRDEADMVNGSRVLGGYERQGWLRAAGVKFFSFVVSLLVGRAVTDVSNGYRAYRVASLAGLRLSHEQYYTAEHLIVALKRELRYTEVPIDIARRKAGFSKKGSSVTYAVGFAQSIFRSWLHG